MLECNVMHIYYLYICSKKSDQHKNVKINKDKVHLSVKHNHEVLPSLKDSYNDALGPPYHILLDTNYVNFSIKNRLDLFRSIMDCLLAKCMLYVFYFKAFFM